MLYSFLNIVYKNVALVPLSLTLQLLLQMLSLYLSLYQRNTNWQQIFDSPKNVEWNSEVAQCHRSLTHSLTRMTTNCKWWWWLCHFSWFFWHLTANLSLHFMFKSQSSALAFTWFHMSASHLSLACWWYRTYCWSVEGIFLLVLFCFLCCFVFSIPSTAL